MSDNVVWLQNGVKSLQEPPSPPPTPPVVPGGGGPHDPGVEARVTALESDMKDVRASLRAIEMSSARMETALGALATRADVSLCTGSVQALSERVAAQADRLGKVERAIDTTIATALSKTLGASGVVGMVSGIAAIIAAGVAAVSWALHHFNLG